LSGSDMVLYLRKKASSSTSSSGVVADSVNRNSVVTSRTEAILPIFSADGFGSSLFSSSHTVEAVLEANPGLAARAQPFVSGVVIRLPDLAAARNDVINLWD